MGISSFAETTQTNSFYCVVSYTESCLVVVVFFHFIFCYGVGQILENARLLLKKLLSFVDKCLTLALRVLLSLVYNAHHNFLLGKL